MDKATDLFARLLSAAGLNEFFSVTGGAAVNIIDSLVECGGMRATFHNHEQAAALAADSYARLEGLGLCVVTTGPGVTNALTGTVCSWQDSIPTVYVSGQARKPNMALGHSVRQAGTQHLDVENLVGGITKGFYLVNDAEMLPELVHDALSLAQSGRPGPVWIDFPLDEQLRRIEPRDRISETQTFEEQGVKKLEQDCVEVLAALSSAQRPLIVLGRGAASSHVDLMREFVMGAGIPVVRTWGGVDCLSREVPFDCGRVGVSGQRAANIVASKADTVLCLGARLGQAVTGPTLSHLFDSASQLFVIDCDPNEIGLVEHLVNVRGICSTVNEFIETCLRVASMDIRSQDEWVSTCISLKRDITDTYGVGSYAGVDQYNVVRHIDSRLQADDIFVVDGGGTGFYVAMQVFGQQSAARIVIPTSTAPMGTGIPQAIGASRFNAKANIVLLIGDGSLPFNMQELALIAAEGLNVKIVVLDNDGYLSIRDTQRQFLDGRFYGAVEGEGLHVPNALDVGRCFGLPSQQIETESDYVRELDRALSQHGPVLLNVRIRGDQEIFPRQGFRKLEDGSNVALPLSQMWPHL